MDGYLRNEEALCYVLEQGLLTLDDVIEYLKGDKEVRIIFYTYDKETSEVIPCPEQHSCGVMIEKVDDDNNVD